MSMNNSDILTNDEVLSNQFSGIHKDDATATSILESAIENSIKWDKIISENLVTKRNLNNASDIIGNRASDSESDEAICVGIQQQDRMNSVEQAVSETVQEDDNPSYPMNEENKISDNVCEEDVIASSCEMCHNYEVNLTKMQDAERNLKEQLLAALHLVDRYQNELSGERLYRKEMETRTTTLCADNEKEVNIAKSENEECVKQLAVADERCERLIHEQRSNIGRLEECLSTMDKDMQDLNRRYLRLLGTNRKCAAEMQAQTIELPQDVDQLQFLCLQLREELIETRAAKEYIEVTLKDEIATLEAQRKEDEMEKRRIEDDYAKKVNGVSQELGFARSQIDSMKNASSKVEEMNKMMAEYRKVIEDLEKQLQSVQKERADLEMTVALNKQKCAALQQELDTSETVQKDFVKLSQNLQIELEKIRQAEQEVRWQFDEDVHACNQCQSNFSKSRAKLHCYHCGKIFCPACLTATIPSGPHRRLAKVCQVCHTLLSRDSAPFFSHCMPAT
uniref:FYVE-type domain-containing protein n=1 Tax=Setaria digitata TaxID=48799 RepID=A0A915PT63_9BILA